MKHILKQKMETITTSAGTNSGNTNSADETSESERPPPKKARKQLFSLSCQLIQRAKCFQTIVRLGTHTLKVPTYNSLKALKGAMFYLPLPLEKTMETFNEVGIDSNHLPDPELYIIINGQPTKSNNVWRSLVDVNKIKAELRKLKEINWQV